MGAGFRYKSSRSKMLKIQNQTKISPLRWALPVAFVVTACVTRGEPEEIVDWDGDYSSGGDTAAGGSAAAGGSTAAGGTASGGAANGGGIGEGGSAPAAKPLPLPPTSDVARPSGDVGGFKVLDWAGFDAAFSYTFDDANRTQIDNYDALNDLGVPLTFYLQTGKADAKNAIWAQAVLDGHELGNHTKSHKDGGAGIDQDTDDATVFIRENFGVDPLTMAAPYGDPDYVDVAETRFLINRGVNGGSIAPGNTSSRFNLKCNIPAEEASAKDMIAPVDSVLTTGNWQIFLVHGFTGGSDGAYQPVGIDEFVTSVEYASSKEALWIDTVLEVGAYWIAQALIESAEPLVDGDETTWTWELPDHFPEGRIVRVTVDGGTLSQDGDELNWDEHGYYEVDLDVGSLTLAP